MKAKHALIPFLVFAFVFLFMHRQQDYRFETKANGSFKVQISGLVDVAPEEVYMVQDTITDYVRQYLAYEGIKFEGEWAMELIPNTEGYFSERGEGKSSQAFVLAADVYWSTKDRGKNWLSGLYEMEGLTFEVTKMKGIELEGNISGKLHHPDRAEKTFKLKDVNFKLKLYS